MKNPAESTKNSPSTGEGELRIHSLGGDEACPGGRGGYFVAVSFDFTKSVKPNEDSHSTEGRSEKPDK